MLTDLEAYHYLNNALNSIYERALCLVYQLLYELLFDGKLKDNKQKSIHGKNIEWRAIEIYKLQAGLRLPIMIELFVSKENKYYHIMI